MKLGTETASMTNYLMSGTKGQPTPFVGMGATKLGWTDRYPATIVEVLNDGKLIAVQEDKSVRVDKNGMSEDQDYEFTPNPAASLEYYKLNKSGAYRAVTKNEKGNLVFCGGGQLRIGERDRYHDYSF